MGLWVTLTLRLPAMIAERLAQLSQGEISTAVGGARRRRGAVPGVDRFCHRRKNTSAHRLTSKAIGFAPAAARSSRRRVMSGGRIAVVDVRRFVGDRKRKRKEHSYVRRLAASACAVATIDARLRFIFITKTSRGSMTGAVKAMHRSGRSRFTPSGSSWSALTVTSRFTTMNVTSWLPPRSTLGAP